MNDAVSPGEEMRLKQGAIPEKLAFPSKPKPERRPFLGWIV
jgi:hypothetical protein